MKIAVVAILDIKAGTFMQPNFVISDAFAVRAFADEVNGDKTKSMIAKHPEDFALHRLSTFDDQTGKFEEDVRLLARGVECVTG